MTQKMKEEIANSIRNFRLPRYEEIPDVGLYLEQTAKYINGFLEPLPESTLTASMISNYVKKRLIASPLRKQYSREQIAYLIFIALAKNILSLDALSNMVHLQQRTYDLPRAYEYFRLEFESLLRFSFELTDTLETHGEDQTDESRLFHTCIAALTQKLYLERCLQAIAAEEHK